MSRKKRYPQSKRKSVFAEVDDIAHQKRARSAKWQQKAGILQPVKTSFYPGFTPAQQLAPELNTAMQRIWEVGHSGDLDSDRIVQRLYCDISRGEACLDEEGLITLGKLEPEKLRAVAHWLVQGKSLERAVWAVRQEQEKKM